MDLQVGWDADAMSSLSTDMQVKFALAIETQPDQGYIPSDDEEAQKYREWETVLVTVDLSDWAGNGSVDDYFLL